MAEFAPNLDDGEMWLPSEIIADLGLRRLHHSNAATAARVRGAYHHTFDVEGLASQLAALSPLDRVQRLPAAKLPPLQGLKPVGPAARFELEERELGTGLGRPVYGMGFGACSRPGVTRPGPTQIAQAQACGPETVCVSSLLSFFFFVRSVEAFGRAPQRPLRPIQSRLGTVRPAGQGRESGGGTGVFLPRVINNNEARKKHHSKFAYATGGEQQKQQPTRSTAMWKLERPFQPTSEMRLPQEWTY
ncbi:unnamed protein product [Musa acuminata subsp. malaccensis]|uniref:(wild Malaysian banana) hypothetical protein n=1 Tax=Musa acuminata subsp. malaccensis TaxID=214687 RepID=A0A8D7B6L7_MUSAM|nr:unnamed protein product [Musa acuminata subsp. malaccensis]